jgi:SAM-dependent methyltransferase
MTSVPACGIALRIKERIPPPWRRRARALWRETPNRLADIVPDLLDGLRPSRRGFPLPPPRLRFRAAGTTRRRDFLSVGRTSVAAIQNAFLASRNPRASFSRWLDFGCGAGRIARHLVDFEPILDLWGVDVDADAVAWASRHLPGHYRIIPRRPPVDMASSFFDVVYAGSVFTHLDEEGQSVWLSELHRILRSGGLLIASTHGPDLTYSRPDLTRDQHRDLQKRGFLFAPSQTPRFNDDGAFHSKDYLIEAWGRLYGLLFFSAHGLDGYQDLSVWQKW